MSKEVYHVPVLFHESIAAMQLGNGNVFVDVTYGGGGHSKEILKNISEDSFLVAFDQDDDALNNIVEDDKLVFVNANFRFLKNFLKYHELEEVDAVLADLGVSSHQFDIASRGFSIRSEGQLDMRMNQSGDLTAEKIINGYSEEDLIRIFKI